MTASPTDNWYWTPDLKIVRHVAQPDGISQVDECSDVAYLEAEKERLEKKRLECLEGAESAIQASFKLYFKQLLPEVDYQLEYVNQRLSELRKPAEFLGDKNSDQPEKISPRKTESEFLGDNQNADSPQISPRKTESEFLGDKPNADSNQISPRKNRRNKGLGSGSIEWRLNKGKYLEAYYHYEFWDSGERHIKSSKYIPKGKLERVQRLDNQKAPVREILKLLGVKL